MIVHMCTSPSQVFVLNAPVYGVIKICEQLLNLDIKPKYSGDIVS